MAASRPPKCKDIDELHGQEFMVTVFTEMFVKYLNPIQVLFRLNSLSADQKDIVHKESERSREQAVHKLVEFVKQEKCYSEFIDALKEKNCQRLLEALYGDTIPDEKKRAHETCELLVLLLQDDIMKYISDPITLARKLQEQDYLSDEDMSVIDAKYQSQGKHHASIEIFQRVNQRKTDWALSFFTIMKHNPNLLEMLQVDPEVKDAEYGIRNSANVRDGGNTWEQSDDDDGDDGFSDEEKGDQSSKTFTLYNYQHELSEMPLEGKNTIICAPTGSGKTRVALHIIQEHLIKRQDKTKKIVFLARTTPLVHQQAKTFHKYLTDYKVLAVTGESDYAMHLHTVLKLYDIFVLTPQILDNHLRDKKIESITVFSLLVFDECHHTRKGEPYNNVMKKYLNEKRTGKENLPQVIGLTASLGVEKATTCDEAMGSILKLCANMDVYYVSTVQKNRDELKEKVPVPDERLVQLTANRQDEARQEILKTIIEIEDHLEEACRDLNDASLLAIVQKKPSDINCQAYGQWAVKIKQEARILNTTSEEAKNHVRTIMVTAQQLEVYNAALDIHDLVRLKDVELYLDKKLRDNMEKNKHSDVESELSKLFRELKKKLRRYEQSDVNPNLSILAEKLITLRKEKGEDSLGIIFVRTRATCYALCEWMNCHEELNKLNPMAFTGAGAHEDEGGMTQNEQDAIISWFREGKTKLIVATSVAEEGLDIPECNIVFRYNHVGNEITTVQTRGRSRKKGGVSVLLGYEKVLCRERLNVERSKMMSDAIRKLNSLANLERIKRINDYQKEAIEAEEMNEAAKSILKMQKIHGKFSLVCVRCQSLTIKSEFIRTIHKTHHVVIQPDFMHFVDVRPNRNKIKPFDGIQFVGKLHCKKCHNYLGVTFVYQGLTFPAIKLDNFQVQPEGSEIFHVKKWKDIPFHVLEMQSKDYKTMFGKEPEEWDNDEAAQKVKEATVEEDKDLDETELKYI